MGPNVQRTPKAFEMSVRGVEDGVMGGGVEISARGVGNSEERSHTRQCGQC